MSTFYDESEYDDNVTSQGPVLRRLLKVLKPHWKTMLFAMIGIALVSFLDAYFTILNKRIIDEGIAESNISTLVRLFSIYASIVLAQSFGFFLFIYLIGLQGERVRYDLRKALFNHIQKLSLSYFSKTPLGWIMSRVTSDTLIRPGLLPTSSSLRFICSPSNRNWH